MTFYLQTIFPKGKHEGKTLKEVIDHDPGYVGFLQTQKIQNGKCLWFVMDIEAFKYYQGKDGCAKNKVTRMDNGRR